jgi:hypothetical protein
MSISQKGYGKWDFNILRYIYILRKILPSLSSYFYWVEDSDLLEGLSGEDKPGTGFGEEGKAGPGPIVKRGEDIHLDLPFL